MAATEVRSCDCVSASTLTVKVGRAGKSIGEIPWFSRTAGIEFQERRYGKGKRLHNVKYYKGQPKGATCTICGRKKD